MAHFAKLNDDNIVETVIVVHNNELLDENGIESEQKGIDFCQSHFGGRWIQTSYNSSFRKNYSGVGSLYDTIRDAFITAKPYESWILNEETCRWEAPSPCPQDGQFYDWDETSLSWIELLAE